MAGEVWRGYDANSQGKKGFDVDDLKHLQGEGWSNNDIMRAAAASGNVHSGADVRLKKLNTETTDIYRIPDSVKDDMIERGGLGSYHAQLGAGYTHLGGDKKNMHNWHITGGANQDERWNNRFGMIHHNNKEWEEIGAKNIDGYNYASSTKRGDNKEDRSVMTWQGINADGSANALSGTYTEKGEDGNIETRDLTWRLPSGYLNSEEPKEEKTRSSTPSSSSSVPEFDLSDWIKPERKPPAPSGDSGDGSGGGDLTPPAETPHVSQGFEEIVNKVYERPTDWMGDVWKPEGSSRTQRFSGSGSFTDAIDRFSQAVG